LPPKTRGGYALNSFDTPSYSQLPEYHIRNRAL